MFPHRLLAWLVVGRRPRPPSRRRGGCRGEIPGSRRGTGPGINIKRSPLCGRNFEYVSEDSYLAGRLAATWIEGLQSQQVGASVKHFAVNNQETDRLRISADVDERTLREIYLPAFEHVVTTAQEDCDVRLQQGQRDLRIPEPLAADRRVAWRMGLRRSGKDALRRSNESST